MAINLLEKVHVSIGSAIVLGLKRGIIDERPTTAYLLICRNEKCSANCGFCPQARESKCKANMLSRVTWPEFPIEKVIRGIEKTAKSEKIKRVCMQSLNYKEAFNDVLMFVKKIKSKVNIPISVSCKPLNHEKMKKWANAGVERVSIPLDAATEKIFDRIKGKNIDGPYNWKKQLGALKEAVEIFGKGNVTTHIIVGFEETEKELCQIIQWCIDSAIFPGLFAFTPISGTIFQNILPPTLTNYRRIQLLHYILTNKKARLENMEFNTNGNLTNFGISKQELLEIINTGEPFLTSGCPGCNRPYYNERPRGPFYNYPRKLTTKEIESVKTELRF
jgi:biotin synthase